MPTSVTQKCLQIHNWVKLHLKGVTCKCTQNTPFQVYTAFLLPQSKLHPECNASVHKKYTLSGVYYHFAPVFFTTPAASAEAFSASQMQTAFP